ncbi:MAG: 3-hydroxybutyryl-CoA dehydrogenase [Candidatus Wallbacteria bacterium]|nr:3-hydroxybutyryl-CoA dehydrogenase [Candidatus Wallbacteria bacterium]
MEMKKIGVVGAGTMGHGIALICAKAKFSVTLLDISLELVEKGYGIIEKFLQKSVEKEKITATEKTEILSRIEKSTALESLKDADFVVEAILEEAKSKFEIFNKLDGIVKTEAILATNTSSISITAIAAQTQRPDKVIGMHFMNPVPVMKLVEVIRGMVTSDATLTETMNLTELLGKTPVVVNDYPGFISNRLLMPMINEAAYALMEGVATEKGIDKVMMLGMNHPMGPLALADLIGLDTCLYIMEVLYEGFKDPKYRPCPLLKKMVAARYLGKKTKKGFYEYE